MNKKVFFKLLVFALFTCAIVVGINVKLNSNNVILSDLALSNIEILAQSEGGSKCNTGDCPGGCCDWTSGSTGDKCSACCPVGKDPTCNSSGCNCK